LKAFFESAAGMLMVALAIVIAIVDIAWLHSPPLDYKRPAEQREHSPSSNANAPKHDAKAGQPPAAVNNAPADDLKPKRSNDAQSGDRQPYKGWWYKLTTDPNATFAGVVAFLTLALVAISALQARRLRQTVEAAVDANRLNREAYIGGRRAWLSIEDAKLKYPTLITEDGIEFAVDVTVKNLGQTPAMSVWIDVESYYAENNPERYADAERRFTAKLRQHPAAIGSMLFPNDTLTEGHIWGDDAQKIKHAISTRPSGEQKVGFSIFIGVSYRIVGDTAAHITYVAHGLLNVAMSTSVAREQRIDLPREPFNPGEAD
jgi:hypothetical protein